MAAAIIILAAVLIPPHLEACRIFISAGIVANTLSDPLAQLLQRTSRCPKDVMEFKKLLQEEGASLASTMVANRGFHNPAQASFSFFEMVEIANPIHLKQRVHKGEFFFGHFTEPGTNNTLGLDQHPFNPSLMIELIVWDAQNEMFNFYELLGSQQGSNWFYRGNSADIWEDTALLHRRRQPGQSIFGTRLRCSGCHIAGGPIMKEMIEPFDSWWRKERPLPLSGRTADAATEEIINALLPPNTLADQTKLGIRKLMNGKPFKDRQVTSPQIALRPLFCTEEINLSATPQILDGAEEEISVPSGFFVDERLVARHEITTSKELYLKALRHLKSNFPEIDRLDGDHAWNTAVKSTADLHAINTLQTQGMIDDEFIADVLAVDFARPVLSQKRCSMLKLLPTTWSEHWQTEFQENLKREASTPALELFENLTKAKQNLNFHRRRAAHFVDRCKSNLEAADGVQNLVHYLAQTRAEIYAAEISQNPRGQILEPGFRVIFPIINPPPRPWQLNLDENCHARK